MHHRIHWTRFRLALVLAGVGLLLAACGAATSVPPTGAPPQTTPAAEVIVHDPDEVAELVIERDPDVPELPFADNPDPLQCGIPVQWGTSNNQAWLTGIYEDEFILPTVFLYDSHLRTSIQAHAPHGAEVEVVLFQANPELNYYMVRIVDAPEGEPREGWIPAPFLSFEQVELGQEVSSAANAN